MKIDAADLQPDEQVVASCDVAYGSKMGVLVATDRRLLLKLRKAAADGFTYDELEEIVPVKERNRYRLDVYVGRQVYPLYTTDVDAPAVVDAARAAVQRANEAKGVDLRFASIVVAGGTVTSPEGSCPVRGVTVEVESGGAIRGRPRIGAVVLFGVFGLAAQRQIDERTLYLTIAGDGLGVAVELPADRVSGARAFAVKLAALAGPARAAAPADDIPGQIKKLADLRDAGVLTDEEFTSKKAELLARM